MSCNIKADIRNSYHCPIKDDTSILWSVNSTKPALRQIKCRPYHRVPSLLKENYDYMKPHVVCVSPLNL